MLGLLLGSNYYPQSIRFLSSKKTILVSFIWIILFVVVYFTGNRWLKSITGVIGIIALLNICILIMNQFDSKTRFAKIVSLLSYASFCAYLFHREVFWGLLRIYSVSLGWPVFFELLLIGVPLTFIVAYLTQLLYDMLLKAK